MVLSAGCREQGVQFGVGMYFGGMAPFDEQLSDR